MPHPSAGFASRVITPRVGEGIAGFIAREQTSDGVLDALELTALALGDGDDRAVVLTADLLAADRGFVAELRTELASHLELRPEAVAFSVTHTHAAPSFLHLRHMGPVSEEYRSHVLEAARAAAEEALGAMRPCSAQLRSGLVRGLSHNRRDRSAEADTEWSLLELLPGEGGAPILVASWQCHPVGLGAANRSLSADYPGVLRRTLRERTGTNAVTFLNGCFGDQNPLLWGRDGVRSTGRGLAEAILDSSAPARPVSLGALHAVSREATLALDRRYTRADAEAEKTHWEAAAAANSDPGLRRADLAMVDWAEELAAVLDSGEPIDDPSAEVQVVRLGELALCFLPCEPLSALGLALRDTESPRCVLPVGAANGMVGYVGLRSDYAAAGYELDIASRYYGLLPLMPGAGELLLDIARDLIAQRPA